MKLKVALMEMINIIIKKVIIIIITVHALKIVLMDIILKMILKNVIALQILFALFVQMKVCKIIYVQVVMKI